MTIADRHRFLAVVASKKIHADYGRFELGRGLEATSIAISMTIAGGTKLGRYEIRSQLGAGGMGEVYQARDTQLVQSNNPAPMTIVLNWKGDLKR